MTSAEIQFDLVTGNAFFETENGVRVELNEVIKTNEPGTGYMHFTNTSGIAVYLEDGSDFLHYEFISL